MAQQNRKRNAVMPDLKEDIRVSLKFRLQEEVALYREMKAQAARQGVTLRAFIINLFREQSRKSN